MIELLSLPAPLAVRRALLFFLLCLSLAACQETPSTTPVPPDTPVPTSPPAGPATAVLATLEGTVVSASDVAGQPDSPLPNQLVLLLPQSEAPALLESPAGDLTDQALRFMQASVQEAPAALSALQTGPDGTFTASLAPGAYLLCLADAEGSAPPYNIRGCARLSLPAGRTTTVEVSTMFGEVVLTPGE